MVNYIIKFEFENSKIKEKAIDLITSFTKFGYSDINTGFEIDDKSIFFYKLLKRVKDNGFDEIETVLKENGIDFKTSRLIADSKTYEFRKDDIEEFKRFKYALLDGEDIELIESFESKFPDFKGGNMFEFMRKYNNEHKTHFEVYEFTNFKTEFIKGLEFAFLSKKDKESGKYLVSLRVA